MLSQLLNMAFLFAGLALFLVAGIGVFWQKWAVLASVPALLLVMSANLDRVESFKASFPTSAVEAKMRELNQTVDDAKEAIRQIRELAVVTAEALIDLRLNSHALSTGGGGTDEYSEQDTWHCHGNGVGRPAYRAGCRDGSALLPSPPLAARDHPARDLALSMDGLRMASVLQWSDNGSGSTDPLPRQSIGCSYLSGL
jgi:hypothetical protein